VAQLATTLLLSPHTRGLRTSRLRSGRLPAHQVNFPEPPFSG